MILIYLALAVLGVILTVVLSRRRSRYAVMAAAGTLLAVFAIVTGFSIGIYVAAVAVVLLVISIIRMGREQS